MIPNGLLADLEARRQARELDAVSQTGEREGQLQLSQATTVPLQDLPTDSQPGQLQQSNISTDSPRVRSFENSISSSASIMAAGLRAGIRSVAVSSFYDTIFYEIVRIQTAYPSFDIDIINAQDQAARANFLQYVATLLEIQPAKESVFSEQDFLRALESEEKRLSTLDQIERKKKEQSILTDRLNELKSEYEERIEKEVESRENRVQQQGQEAIERVLNLANTERANLAEERETTG